MSVRDSLTFRSAWRRFEADARPAGMFEKRLHDFGAGAQELNLGADAVHLAAEIAALEPVLDDDQRLALIALILVSVAALQEGSTRVPVTGPHAREPMRRMLAALWADAAAPIAAADACAAAIERLLESGAASAVVGQNPSEYKPLLYLAPFVYHQRIRAAETALATRLAELVTGRDAVAFEETRLLQCLADVRRRPSVVDGGPMRLSDEQCAAVATALRSRCTVISGGPGTGKTSIVLAILRVLSRLGVAAEEIALAAPTGKAANRMGECVREGLARVVERDSNDDRLMASSPEPATIHRLLGYSPSLGRFSHRRNNPLLASIVIVDEGSMLDLTLMQRLLDAIRPEARLIMLGDADQLPSVAAGAVFRDLMPQAGSQAGYPIAGVRLGHSYRLNPADAAGRAILSAAGAIIEGRDPMQERGGDGAPLIVRRISPAEIAFEGAEHLAETAGPSTAFLDRWYAERLRGEAQPLARRTYLASPDGFAPDECDRLRKLFAFLAAARILCVTRVFETGADRINERLHRQAVEESGPYAERNRFLPGEPIMMLRNDYERMLFNGDQGVALRVRQAGGEPLPMAVFPRGQNFAAFRLDALREDLELSYAMTVHKAQGSEFDSAALILPAIDLPILTREIVYTAVSRARKSVVLIGDENILRLAIAKKTERYSGLREQLEAQLGSRRPGQMSLF